MHLYTPYSGRNEALSAVVRFSEDCAMLRRLAGDKADVNERLSGLAVPSIKAYL